MNWSARRRVRKLEAGVLELWSQYHADRGKLERELEQVRAEVCTCGHGSAEAYFHDPDSCPAGQD